MIVVLVLINGILALAEFAIMSARKAHLKQLADKGEAKAQAALDLAENPGDFLSTVQVGITLVGVLAGAFGGATITGVLEEVFLQLPILAPYARTVALTIVVASITLLSLVLGELVPKRLALSRAEAYAVALAGPMRLLSRLVRPLVRLLSLLTNLVLRILRVTSTDEAPPSEAEIMVMLRQATRAGVFAEAEHEMVEGVFRLGDRRLGVLITPRTEIEWLDLDDSPQEHLEYILSSTRSHFPVGQGSLDNLRGTVSARMVLTNVVETGMTAASFDLNEFVQPAVFAPENMPALQALDLLRNSPSPLLLVIDEFGGVQGLVTLSDLVESVVGDLTEDGELGDHSLVQREDGSMLIDGMVPIDELLEIFNLPDLPGYEQGLFETLGGFVMNFLGRIPAPGDRFDWNDLRFEVVDMDGLRVDKVLVLRAPTQ